MKSQKFRLLTQTLGTLALIAFAALGLMSVLGYDAPFVSAASAAEETARAVASTARNIPASFNYEGTLRDPDGTLTNDAIDITAKLYAAPIGGAVVYTEGYTDVNVREGEFNIVLGDDPGVQDLKAAFSNTPLYIGLAIDGASEITPRERVHAVP